VRSPDGAPPAPPVLRKEGEGYVLHTDVEEVALNCTVLEGKELVPNLKREDFQVSETVFRRRSSAFSTLTFRSPSPSW